MEGNAWSYCILMVGVIAVFVVVLTVHGYSSTDCQKVEGVYKCGAKRTVHGQISEFDGFTGTEYKHTAGWESRCIYEKYHLSSTSTHHEAHVGW